MSTKYMRKFPIVMGSVGGLVVVVVMVFTLLKIGDAINLFRVIGFVVVFLLFVLMGWVFSYTGSTIFQRKVDNSTDPDNLVLCSTYWLNGETKAFFVEKDAYSGFLRFKIEGINNPKFQDDTTALKPGQVRLYISTEKEV